MNRYLPTCILAFALLPGLALLAGLVGCGDQAPASSKTATLPASGPPSASGAAIDRPRPDNSAANRSDGQDALTPMNQGASAADTRETADIRKAIMADPMLSVDAQNIKIITSKGQLTLRGVVDSVDERKRVYQIVENVTATDVFDDQLRVR
jgi:osmotically-inducible protein OsmY